MLSELLQTATLKDAPAYWFLGALHILLAKSESTGGAYSLIHFTAPSGLATPYHLHHTEDEAFYVLEGELTVIRDGKKIVLGAGGYVFLPRGVSHGVRCSSEKEARVLILVIPGGNVGFVGMMLEMGLPAREGFRPQPEPPDLERLKTVCEKNNIDILGPLPEV